MMTGLKPFMLCVLLLPGGRATARQPGDAPTAPDREKRDTTISGPLRKMPTDFGLIVEKLTPELAKQLGCQNEKGVAVKAVVPLSDADAAGLRPGDLIEAVNRVAVSSLDDYKRAAKREKKGEGVPILIRRGQKTFLTGFELQPDSSEEDDLSSFSH